MPATIDAPGAPSAAAARPCSGGRRSRLAPDDACLRTRFRAGDESALADVYARYRSKLLVIGMRRLGDRDLANEAVQQAFLQAWRFSGSYDPARALAPWLYAIMRRVCVDLFRRDRRTPDLFPDGTVPDGQGGPDAGETFEQVWEGWAVREAVDSLPAVERDVVRLTYLHDLTFAEAADRLDVPIGTVKSRSFRAHRRLAEVLAGFNDVSFSFA
jgi:RNA polymerase sigma-70 factor (ECF subfamily)